MNDREIWRLKRLQKRIKIKEIAESLSVSSSYICAYENDRDSMSDYYLQKYKQYITSK